MTRAACLVNCIGYVANKYKRHFGHIDLSRVQDHGLSSGQCAMAIASAQHISQVCLWQSLFSLSPFSFLKMGHSRPFFFIFVFSMELHVNVHYKCLPMTGFEPETSRTGSNCSINSVTTTAPSLAYFFTLLFLISPIQLFKPFFSSSSFNTYIPLSLTLRLQL